MITQGIEKALKDILLEVYFSANEIGSESEQMLEDSLPQVLTLVRAEAINLADKIIGKDIVLHNLTDTHGDTFLDPSEKAIYDKQVQQRIELAKYQNPPQVGPTGPEQINDELSENEA